MTRVKRGTAHIKKRKRFLSKTKGYKWGRKNLIKRAKEAVVKAGAHAYVDRKKNKRNRRAVWQVKIGAFVREKGLSYSKFIDLLKKNKIDLDRKILADFSVNNKKIFTKIIEEIKK
ncbi:MAG: 50S ribosomal protein L20 [bacterium]